MSWGGRLLPALESDDPIERSRWLFDDHPDMEAVSGEDYQQYDERLRQLRLSALVAILQTRARDGLETLVAVAGSPRAVGLGLGPATGSAMTPVGYLESAVLALTVGGEQRVLGHMGDSCPRAKPRCDVFSDRPAQRVRQD
jgi:hypothetical protein